MKLCQQIVQAHTPFEIFKAREKHRKYSLNERKAERRYAKAENYLSVQSYFQRKSRENVKSQSKKKAQLFKESEEDIVKFQILVRESLRRANASRIKNHATSRSNTNPDFESCDSHKNSQIRWSTANCDSKKIEMEKVMKTIEINKFFGFCNGVEEIAINKNKRKSNDTFERPKTERTEIIARQLLTSSMEKKEFNNQGGTNYRYKEYRAMKKHKNKMIAQPSTQNFQAFQKKAKSMDHKFVSSEITNVSINGTSKLIEQQHRKKFLKYDDKIFQACIFKKSLQNPQKIQAVNERNEIKGWQSSFADEDEIDPCKRVQNV